MKKNKKFLAKTKDTREAEELLSKLTNKEKANFSQFWEKHENQIRLNKVAIPEFLKKAIRDNNMEMFRFVWEKANDKNNTLGKLFSPISNKKKNAKKELGKDLDLVDDLVLVSVVSRNNNAIKYLGEKIGYKNVINKGTAFKSMLECERIDMFKSLYEKATDISDKAIAIELATKKNIAEIVDFCLEKESNDGKLNNKLVETWEKSIENLIKSDNEELAMKIFDKVEHKMPNFNYAKLASVATRYNKNDITRRCLNNFKEDILAYTKIFEKAVLANNKEMIKEIIPKISGEKEYIQNAVLIKKYENNDEIADLIIEAAKLNKQNLEDIENNEQYLQIYKSFTKDNMQEYGKMDEFTLVKEAINVEKSKVKDLKMKMVFKPKKEKQNKIPEEEIKEVPKKVKLERINPAPNKSKTLEL